MKSKKIRSVLGVVMALSMEASGLAAAVPAMNVYAAETEVETEIETEAVTEEAVEETEAVIEPTEITVQAGEEEVTMLNCTAVEITEAVAEAGEGDTENLTMTDAAGKQYLFEGVQVKNMTDPQITTQNGFLYIEYINESGEKKTAAETADEILFDEPVTMFVVNQVNVRAAADSNSDILTVAPLGGEVVALGAAPKWYKVQIEDVEGYISRAYLSTEKEAADQAVKEEEAAVAAAQAAAAAAAAQAQRSNKGGGGKKKGKTEVSRQKYDDCDGSGHGYYEIKYSDGSTAIVEY